jgi:hypothetical protein
MNCVELQASLVEIEDGSSAAQQAHLKTCPECSALVADLSLIAASATELREADEPTPQVWRSIEIEVRHINAELSLIAASAGELREADEPSPRVWNSIAIALRQEGLIHPPRSNRSLLPSLSSRWYWTRWMVPAAAILLLSVGLYLRPRHSAPVQVASNVVQPVVPEAASDAAIAGLNDDDLLQEVSEQTPAMQAQFAESLRHVNEYIQDAKNVVATDPNDEEARRSLMDAYQEKAMLFELAMDRSLP